MKDSTIKIKILKTLLESPKTIGEIAIELGYIDKKGHGKYNVIDADLKSLEQYGFIHRVEQQKKRLGAPPTTYDIVYDISVLRDIVKKYESLIPDLQKSDKIIALIWDYFIQRSNEMFPTEEAAILDDKLNVIQSGSELEILNKLLFPYRQDMFRFSPSYFKNFLTNESFLYSFGEIWKEVYGYVEETEYGHVEDPETGEEIVTRTNYIFLDIDLLFIEAFNYSVVNDFINGYGNPEALKLIRNLKEKQLYPFQRKKITD